MTESVGEVEGDGEGVERRVPSPPLLMDTVGEGMVGVVENGDGERPV